MAARQKCPTFVSDSAPFAVRLTVRTLASSVVNAGPPNYWESGVLGQGVLVVFRAEGAMLGRELSARDRAEEVFFWVREGWGRPWGEGGEEGDACRRPTYAPQGEPTFRKGGGAKGGRKGAGFLGLELVGLGLWKVPGREVEWMWLGREECRNRCLLVLFFRRGTGSWFFEGVGRGSWAGGGAAGYEVGGGVVAPEPASPVPANFTRAEMVARHHELYAFEKRLTKKVEGGEGLLEKAKAEVLGEEEGMAKVDGELQGVKDQIKAHLEEEKERKERRRREEGLAVMTWMTVPLLRRRAALRKLACGLRLGRRGRLPGRGVFPEAG